MTTKTKDRFNLDDQERALNTALADAQQLRTDLVAQFAAGNDVQEQLDAIDEEIVTTKRQLARFSEARAAQARTSTVAAKQAQHEHTITRLADGVLGAETLAELAKAVLLTLGRLRDQLDAVEAKRTEVYATLQGATQDARHGASERVVSDMQHQLLVYVNALTLPTPFLLALQASGVGQKGVIVPKDLIEITVPPFDGTPSPAADVERALASVLAAAAKIEQWSANANGIAKEVA